MWKHDISYILIHARRLLIQGDIVALCDMAETLTQYDKPELMLDFVKMCKEENWTKNNRILYTPIVEEICKNYPDYVVEFAKVLPNDIRKFEQAVIYSHNAKNIFEFAKDIEGVDMKKLQQAIILCDDPNKSEYIRKFASLPRTDAQKLNYYADMFDNSNSL